MWILFLCGNVYADGLTVPVKFEKKFISENKSV